MKSNILKKQREEIIRNLLDDPDMSYSYLTYKNFFIVGFNKDYGIEIFQCDGCKHFVYTDKENDSKEQKIGYIKYWLQKHGDRHNYWGFRTQLYINNEHITLVMERNFDENGEKVDPKCIYISSKELDIENVSNNVLDDIVKKLKQC